MKTILIVYLMLINLIGFAAMALDKRRAIRHKWRIPERTLFLIALLFGSIGVLTGMYVFRHKTKHLSFSIGIPAILVAQLLLLSFLYSWNLRRVQSPSQAVEHELALIEELDEPTIQSFISYENLTNSHLATGTIDQKATDAVALFFKNFSYDILNEEIDGDTATVTVEITNSDMHTVAQDLCSTICAGQQPSPLLLPHRRPVTTTICSTTPLLPIPMIRLLPPPHSISEKAEKTG